MGSKLPVDEAASPTFPRGVSWAIVLLVLAYTALFLVGLARRPDAYQWDFPVYYYATKAYAAGVNPYDPAAVAGLAGRPVLEFRHPPTSLWMLRPFSWMEFDTAYRVFLVFKCLALLGLIGLWSRRFLGSEDRTLFSLFCLVAFSGTLALDLQAGNCLIVEQLLIWSAFALYLQRRYLAFCVPLVIAANFKLFPILFLLLLLLAPERRKYACLAAGAGAFALTMAIPYVFQRELFLAFVQAIRGGAAEPAVFLNPCNMALVHEALDALAARGLPLPGATTGLVAGLLALGVGGASWPAFRRLSQGQPPVEAEKLKIYLACLVYALLIPRFKAYYYILLIVPTYVLMWRVVRKNAVAAITLMIALAAMPTILPPSQLWNYHPLLIAWMVWALYLWELPAWRKDLAEPAFNPKSPIPNPK